MHVDTHALRVIAEDQSRHAADLADAAARLAAVSPPPDAFGSVGTRFLSALNEALAHESRTAIRLGERLAAEGDLATTTATAYVDAENRARNGIGSLGT